MVIDTKSRAVIADDADALRSIRDENVAIAVWERDAISAISNLPLESIKGIRFQAPLGELPNCLETKLDAAGIKKSMARNMLITDVAMLANRFADVMELTAVDVRLEHVTNNACKKFHGDYVTARLICTYVGPGTQWLDGKDAADCDCGEPHDFHQMATGDVAILKGRLWSENYPAIHRSPPIEASGQERLVLVINAPVDR